VQARGQAWVGDAYLSGHTLAHWLYTSLPRDLHPTRAAIQEVLEVLNGCFAFIVETEDAVVAVTDRIRSIPLFYACRGGQYLISDDARRVRDFVGDQVPDELAITEFLLTGYVTGRDTLFPNVNQLQAGEFILLEDRGDSIEGSCHRYYRFLHGDYYDAPEEELYPELDRVWLEVFERLVNSAQGRTLVVPLSGGLDSRLICAMLKRLGVDNVLCFSYGLAGNWEARISEKVAKRLGYPWHFVPYHRKKWAAWFDSEEREAYYHYCDGLSSLPVLQDWPAVWEMKEQDILPQGAVFVPGHAADFVVGGHIPEILYTDKPVSKSDLLTSVFGRHHVLWKWREANPSLESTLSERILSQLRGLPGTNAEDAVNAFEMWDWQERQAKFIVNSVRGYEFWHYGWRLPYWDHAALDFWSHVPLRLRYQKSLYRFYLAKAFGDVFGPSYEPEAQSTLSQTWRSSLSNQILSYLPPSIRSFTRHYVIQYFRHPLAWYGIHGFRRHWMFRTSVGLPKGGIVTSPRYINSYLAHEYLRELR